MHCGAIDGQESEPLRMQWFIVWNSLAGGTGVDEHWHYGIPTWCIHYNVYWCGGSLPFLTWKGLVQACRACQKKDVSHKFWSHLEVIYSHQKMQKSLGGNECVINLYCNMAQQENTNSKEKWGYLQLKSACNLLWKNSKQQQNGDIASNLKNKSMSRKTWPN